MSNGTAVGNILQQHKPVETCGSLLEPGQFSKNTCSAPRYRDYGTESNSACDRAVHLTEITGQQHKPA